MELVSQQHENSILNWLNKHAIEVLIGLMISIGAFQGWMLIDNRSRLSVVETNVDHINKAVNNVDDHEQTLREIVEQMGKDVAVLKSRSGRAD